MKRKTIYLASDNMSHGFGEIAFETEKDVIEFCKKRNAETDEDWGWHAITYYYS